MRKTPVLELHYEVPEAAFQMLQEFGEEIGLTPRGYAKLLTLEALGQRISAKNAAFDAHAQALYHPPAMTQPDLIDGANDEAVSRGTIEPNSTSSNPELPVDTSEVASQWGSVSG